MNRTASGRVERWGLITLVLFTVVSMAGYGGFALHPENLPSTETALRFYSVSFQLFAQLHIVLAFLLLSAVLARHTGRAWLPAFAAVYLLSFAAEHAGTSYGIPFGAYTYTGLLGPRLGGRVPALIPASWFLMAVPSWVLARSAFPDRRGARITFTALGLVVWDLALDPAMSHLTPYWVWQDGGSYYGMPAVNLVGWLLTGSLLALALELSARSEAFHRLPAKWMGLFYGIVASLPLGMLAVAGAWGAIGVTLAAGVAVTIAAALAGGVVPAGEAERPMSEPASSAVVT